MVTEKGQEKGRKTFKMLFFLTNCYFFVNKFGGKVKKL